MDLKHIIDDSKIKQEVISLDYPDEVAEDFYNMVATWKNAKGQPVLGLWKEQLKGSKAVDQERIITEFNDKILEETKTVSLGWNLQDIVKTKKADCLGHMQMLYVLSNALELSIVPFEVSQLWSDEISLPEGQEHVDSMFNLTNGMTIMAYSVIDKRPSEQFRFKRLYTEKGNHWELENLENSFEIYRRIRILDTPDIIAGRYTLNANLCIEMNKYDEAIDLCEAALELSPNFAQAHYNQGVAFGELRDSKREMFHYKEALELDPKHAKSLCNLGAVHYEQNNFQAAFSLFKRSHSCDINYRHTNFNLGIMYNDKGDPKTAIHYLNRIIKFNPDDKEAHALLAKSYFSIGNIEQSQKHLQQSR